MKLYLSRNFIKAYKKLTKNNSFLKSKIKKKIEMFMNEPHHPSLKMHHLKGKMIEDWSFSIEGNIRIIITNIEDGILLVDIGNHSQVYK